MVIEAELRDALARKLELYLISIGLLHTLSVLFFQKEFDVGRIAGVWVDATMSAVRAASHTGGTVALDVRDVKVFDFKALHLSVGLGVHKKVEHVFGGLDGQRAWLPWDATFFACACLPQPPRNLLNGTACKSEHPRDKPWL